MFDKRIIDRVITAVHQPLNFKDYDSTMTVNETNCYAHAIGSTVSSDRRLYRIGALSGKNLDEYYFNTDELKDLFLSDMKMLNLDVEELSIKKEDLIGNERFFLKDNQHIVVLFAQRRRIDDVIREFHFIRFDEGKGWTEKRWNFKPMEFNPRMRWPDYWPNEQVGIYRITR